jgi:hypothetical protein
MVLNARPCPILRIASRCVAIREIGTQARAHVTQPVGKPVVPVPGNVAVPFRVMVIAPAVEMMNSPPTPFVLTLKTVMATAAFAAVGANLAGRFDVDKINWLATEPAVVIFCLKNKVTTLPMRVSEIETIWFAAHGPVKVMFCVKFS